jgi:hypothetical protein
MIEYDPVKLTDKCIAGIQGLTEGRNGIILTNVTERALRCTSRARSGYG